MVDIPGKVVQTTVIGARSPESGGYTMPSLCILSTHMVLGGMPCPKTLSRLNTVVSPVVSDRLLSSYQFLSVNQENVCALRFEGET